MSWDRSLIGRAGLLHQAGGQPAERRRRVHLRAAAFIDPPTAARRSAATAARTRFKDRRAAATATTSGSIRRIPTRYVLTDDGGASINTKQGPVRVTLPNGQMYHVHVDNRVPYWIYSNRQDDGTMRGPMTVSEQTGNGRLPAGSTMPQPWPAAAADAAQAAGGRRRPRTRQSDRTGNGSPTSAAANPALPSPIPRTRTSSTPRVTATK